MRTIKEDVKKHSFKPVYLIYGEEPFLVRSMKKLLLQELVREGDNMNFLKLNGKDCQERKIIDFSETMPFLAEYRVILIENSGWCKGAPDTLVDYLKTIPDTSCLIFVEQEVDKRNRLYKQIKSLGYVCECKKANDRDLCDWILRYLTKAERKIKKTDMDYLIEQLGDSMDRIAGELEKLIAYTTETGIITKEDIDAICVKEVTNQIFAMVDAIGNQNQQKALTLYYDLIALREAPMKILFLLIRQFNIMLQLKELENSNISTQDMAGKVGLQSFVVNKTLAQCKNFKHSTLKNALNYCIRLEEAVKQGNLNEKVAVEMIIIKYAG